MSTDPSLYHTPNVSIFTSSTVLDASGSSVPLKDLFQPSSVLVIAFIRHWNCAACQGYVQALSKTIPLDELKKKEARLVIVGHGDPKHIDDYKKLTGCTFHVYCDPDKHLFKTLGMGKMGTGELKASQPTYSDRGVFGDISVALTNWVKMGITTGGGSFSQLGGEYVFKTDENGNSRCTYGRKMPNSRDQTPPEALMQELQKARLSH